MPANLRLETAAEYSEHEAVPGWRPEFFDQVENHAPLIAFGPVHDAGVRVESGMHHRLHFLRKWLPDRA